MDCAFAGRFRSDERIRSVETMAQLATDGYGIRSNGKKELYLGKLMENKRFVILLTISLEVISI